ncbi:MAG: imidazolonepropionase-like amidohydrolase [Planctomycetota bacterium]|jgi:imidazolonepropionase-like amidohydrolase
MRNLIVPALAALLLPLAALSTESDISTAPAVLIVHDVTLDSAEDAAHVDIRIEGGLITGVTPTKDETLPGAKVIEGGGRLALPAFIDAWTYTGCETPAPEATQDRPVAVIDDVRAAMRVANRKGIQPSFRAVDVLDFGETGAEAHRKAGFGTLLSVPSGQLLAGRGALVATGDEHVRDLVITSEIFQNGAFSASGRGYPSTLMGYFAQLRQFFYDVQRHEVLEQRREAGMDDPRAAWDPELEAALKLVGGRELYVVRTRSATDVERWIRLADEFGLRIAIAGGRDAWLHAELLAERKIPVFLELDWGKEFLDPKEDEEKKEKRGDKSDEKQSPGDEADMADEASSDELAATPEEGEDGEDAAAEEDADEAKEEEPSWKYTEPMALRLERRRLWEERRDNAIRLQEAGVQIYFGTGNGKPGELVDNLRELVEAGLPAQTATDALTKDAARLLGVSNQLGQVAAGSAATFCLWTADPMTKDAQLALICVDGVASEFEVKDKADDGEGPADGVDVSGRWDLEVMDEESPTGAYYVLTMDEDGKVAGTYFMDSPMGEGTASCDVTGKLSGTNLRLEGSLEFGGMSVDFEVDGEIAGGSYKGTNSMVAPWGEETMDISATHTPDHGHSVLNWGYENHDHERYSCH